MKGKFLKILRGFRFSGSNKKATSFLLIFVALVTTFYFMRSTVQAAVTVDTSSVENATKNGAQRKNFYDNSNNLFWAFYHNGSAIEYSNSSDGSAWTSRGTTGVSTNDFSVWYVQSTATVYMSYTTATPEVLAQKGTLGATSISWGSATALPCSLCSILNSSSISRLSNGKLLTVFSANGSAVVSAQSTNADDTSAWDARVTAESNGSNTVVRSINLVPLSSGNMYAVWRRYDSVAVTSSVRGGSWNGSTWTVTQIEAFTHAATCDQAISAVSDSSDNVHAVYSTCATAEQGVVKYVKYSGSWGTAVNLDSGTTNDYPTIAIDTGNNNNLYALWERGGTVYYKKGVSTYGSGDWDTNPTTLISTGTNKWLSAGYQQGSNKIFLEWTEGTSNPWNVKFETISLNSPPGTPSITAPADAANLIPLTGNSFQAAATDADSDTIKYHIKIFNTTSQSGGNCDGSTFEEQDQNTTQGGWSQAGAYTSGATATYSNGTTLTRGSSYCWQVRGKDPTGSNTFGAWSTPRTFSVNSIPATPTLSSPASGQTEISTLPIFYLRTTDADSNYLRYHLKVYSAQTECNSDSGTFLIRSIDQTSSQTGWQGQDQQTATAYTGAATIGLSQTAIHNYQQTQLVGNTSYWWKGRAIDPGGVNAWTAWTTCQSFTTGSAEVRIQGGVDIRGGTTIQ